MSLRDLRPMRRVAAALHGVAAVVLGLLGCEGSGPPPPPASRVEAVAAKRVGADDMAGFCDFHAKPGAGEPLSLPPTDNAVPDASGRARWVNLWATWCKPCIEEMPMIERFRQDMAKKGIELAVDFVSVDAEAEAVAAFRKQHPATPAGVRLADPDALAGWMSGVGLDPGAGLPIHLFAGNDHRIRCIRAGAVTDSHYEIVAALLE